MGYTPLEEKVKKNRELRGKRVINFSNRGALFALAALSIVSGGLLAQQQSGSELKLDSFSTQQAPQLPIQSPTIVNPQGPIGTDRIYYQTPQGSAERRPASQQQLPAPLLERNEFQEFVLRATGRDLAMFGYNLFDGALSTFAPLDRVPVPSDYAIGPGDSIIVPEDLDKLSWTKELKDWSQIFYQFALGVAGLKVLSDL